MARIDGHDHRFYNSAQAAKGPDHFNSCFFEYMPLDPAPDLAGTATLQPTVNAPPPPPH